MDSAGPGGSGEARRAEPAEGRAAGLSDGALRIFWSLQPEGWRI